MGDRFVTLIAVMVSEYITILKLIKFDTLHTDFYVSIIFK